MPTRTPPHDQREKTGFGDSPRQDSQRPEHGDHADAGGQESTNRRGPRTQAPEPAPPGGATPAPGQRHADQPLPRDGRQAQRPAQDGRFEETTGKRDVETFRSPDAPGFGGDTREPALPDDENSRADSAARRRRR